MNKEEFISYIATKHNCTKVEAERVIKIFTSSIISSLEEGKKVSLMGFGKFYATKMPTREGFNPQTGEVLSIPTYAQVRFSVGQSLKNAVNNEQIKQAKQDK